MPTEDIVMAQEDFMRRGGLFVQALRNKRKSGELPNPAQFAEFPQEYPKMLYISKGVQDVPWQTNDVKDRELKGTVRKEIFDQIIVNSEEEEERVLAGGKTSAAVEEDRQVLIQRCRNAGMKIDLAWSTLRLRRELGDKLDAPEPVDELGALQEKLARLEEMAAMKAKIAALEAQLSGQPAEDVDELRSQLAGLGVVVDKRWGAARLRHELDLATAPEKAA